MRLLQSIILALLALIAGYCLTVTIVSWAVPPGEVPIPTLIVGVVATVLAGLYVKYATHPLQDK